MDKLSVVYYIVGTKTTVMERDWAKSILIFLYDRYAPGIMFNLNEFAASSFNIDGDDAYNAGNLSNILYELQDKKRLIRFYQKAKDGDDFYTSPLGQTIETKKHGTLNNINVLAHLTTDGFEYVKEIIRQQKQDDLIERQAKSTEETNKSVRRTNRFMRENAQRQINLTRASIIVAGASAIFAFGSIATTIIVAKMDSTSTEVQQLKTQLQKQSQIQEQMSQYQKGLDSSLKIFVERSHNEGTNKLNKIQ